MNGLLGAYKYYKYNYICSIDNCKETEHLCLHHNNPSEKEVSNMHFQHKSVDAIITEGILFKELNKDIMLLCSNHHREVHNPSFKLDQNSNIIVDIIV